MSRCFLSIIPLLGLLASPASPQSPSFNGQVAGFVYHPDSRTVRPVLGVPGGSYLASPVMSGVESASIAPDGKWALVSKSGQTVFVKGLASAAPIEMPGDGIIQGADRIVWNRDGSVALLYSTAGNQLQRVRLSDSGALPDPPVDLSSLGTPSAFAIDSTGQQMAFGIPGSGLYLLPAGQSPALLSSIAKPAAIAFNGARIYAVDLDQQQILQFDPDSGASPFASLAQPDGSPLNPVGIAVSGDGSYLMLADVRTRSVLVYETATRNLSNTIALDFAPSRLEALSTGPSFLLNGDTSKEWLLVLDASRIPAVYFVPLSQEQL